MSAPAFLVFDVETTGLPKWGLEADHPLQPRVVQLAALLLDADLNPIAPLNHLIKPNGWVIEPGAAAAHDITMDRCEAEGSPMEHVLGLFNQMADAIEASNGTLVAYNIRFDNKLVRGERRRHDMDDRFGVVREFDPMAAATPICKMPPTERMLRAGFTKFKYPKLEEAHRILCGREMSGAHDALSDVRATVAVMRALRVSHGIDISGERPVSFRGAAE